MDCRAFTLLELVAVIAIIALATSLAVPAFRGESPAQNLRNAVLGFEEFCARVRYSAMENGADRVVVFDLPERRFSAKNPDLTEEDMIPGEEELQLLWELPDGVEFDSETEHSEPDETGNLELFRFFSDGSANASREFILRCRNLRCRFAVSPLTGLLLVKEEESLL